jgi:AcrR family transcriptional regulator
MAEVDMSDPADTRSSPRWREPAQLYAIARSIRGDAGPATQRRIKDALHRIVKRVKLSDVSVLGVAEEAGVSPATFYRYYRDVEHVAQALCMDVIHDLDRAAEFAESDWLGPRGEEAALAFVEEFLAHWRRNKAILRMRNLKAEEGDPFFADLRVHMLRRSTTALVRRMRGPGVPWGAPEPSVVGNLLVGMLERAGAYQDLYRGGAETVARVAASLIYEAVTSRSPAAATASLT